MTLAYQKPFEAQLYYYVYFIIRRSSSINQMFHKAGNGILAKCGGTGWCMPLLLSFWNIFSMWTWVKCQTRQRVRGQKKCSMVMAFFRLTHKSAKLSIFPTFFERDVSEELFSFYNEKSTFPFWTTKKSIKHLEAIKAWRCMEFF